jgi:hypothetical protein
LMGPYKKGGHVTRGVFLALATLMVWLDQSAPAIFFLWLGLTRYPWLEALDTGERFLASLASLAVTLALLFGINRIHGLPAVAAEAQSVAWIVRDTMTVYCLFGTLRAFKAFTTDPTLGIRRISRRLTVSHVLVVTVPVLILVALWISSTYLGVNADRALVTAHALSREEERLHAELAIALGAGGDLDAAARAVADSRHAKWPGTRVFVIQDSLVRRVSGEVVEGERLLPGWVAGLDSLPDRGVVQLANRRWLGAAARRSGRALVLLTPVRELMDSTLSPLVGVTVSMPVVGHDTPELDSLATGLEAMRDTLRHERRRARTRPRPRGGTRHRAAQLGDPARTPAQPGRGRGRERYAPWPRRGHRPDRPGGGSRRQAKPHTLVVLRLHAHRAGLVQLHARWSVRKGARQPTAGDSDRGPGGAGAAAAAAGPYEPQNGARHGREHHPGHRRAA